MDIKEETLAREAHRKIIGTKLIKGEISLVQMVEENPQELFNLLQWQKNLGLYKRLKA